MNGFDYRKRKRSPATNMQEYHRDKRQGSLRTKETPDQIRFREFVSQVNTVLTEYGHFDVELTVSHDPTPSVMLCPLPLVHSESSDVSNSKRSKTEPLDEERTVSSKMAHHEYSTLNQIEVHHPQVSLITERSLSGYENSSSNASGKYTATHDGHKLLHIRPRRPPKSSRSWNNRNEAQSYTPLNGYERHHGLVIPITSRT